MLPPDGKKVVTVDARKINHFGIGNIIRSVFEALLTSNKYAPVALGSKSEILRAFKNISALNFDVKPNNPLGFLFLNRLLARYPPACHINTFYVGVNKLLVPSVLFFYDLIHIKYPRHFLHGFLASKLISQALKTSSVVVVLSKAVKEELENYFSNLRLNIVILKPPVKHSFRNLSEDPKQILAKKEDFYLLVCSNLKPHKGVFELLSLWKDSYPTLFVVARGSKNLEGYQKSNVRIISDFLSEEDLTELYLKARYLVIPSYEEGFGFCFLESRFTYTPVIARPLPVFFDFATPWDFFAEDCTNQALDQAIKQSLTKTYDEAMAQDFKKLQINYSVDQFREGLEDVLDFLTHDSYCSRLVT